MSFEGKNVIVTGGVFGIGSVIAESFIKAGANVIIADIEIAAGQKYVKRLRGELGPVDFIFADMGKESSVKKLIKTVIARYKTIDILINNAGIGNWKSIEKRSVQDWQRVLDVNLTGPYMCVKYALPYMPKGSSIINISSTRALMSEKNTESYSASKGGLLALTHSLALSLSEKKIRANAISPGWIDTSAFGKKGGRRQIKLKNSDLLQHPAGRVGTPYDVAEACLFLADNEKSGFITGQNIIIDGGMVKKMIYK